MGQSGRMLILDAILKEPPLSAGARLLWVLLAEHQGKSVECFPSQEMLAIPLGVNVRQLQTLIKELKNYTRGNPPEPFPLIEVKRMWVGKGRKNRNIYNLLRQPLLTVDRMADGAEEAPLADGDNAQYFAYRSGGDTQDIGAQPAVHGRNVGLTTHRAPLDDTQSSACRSGDDLQDVVAARVTSPDEAGSAVPAGIPPSDTQSSAHRSDGATQSTAAARPVVLAQQRNAQYSAHLPEGDAQGTADGRPAIFGRDSGARPQEMPPGDGGAHAIYTNSQQLRQQQAQPLA